MEGKQQPRRGLCSGWEMTVGHGRLDVPVRMFGGASKSLQCAYLFSPSSKVSNSLGGRLNVMTGYTTEMWKASSRGRKILERGQKPLRKLKSKENECFLSKLQVKILLTPNFCCSAIFLDLALWFHTFQSVQWICNKL